MMTSSRPRIAITVGDPAGIGPEVSLKASADPRVQGVADVRLYGPTTDADLAAFAAGKVSADAGRSAYQTIEHAVTDVQAGRADALVTAPINKEAFAEAGLPWRGHTELLAHLTGAKQAVMMFHSDVLRVVLATVHVPARGGPRTAHQTPDRSDHSARRGRVAAVRFSGASPGDGRTQPACGRARPAGS